jgi:hypothetical protein
MRLPFVVFATAALAAAPVLAQSVTISESAVKVQPLSPSLGETESLAIITPDQAQALTSASGPSLGLLPADEQAVIDSLPRITPAQASTLVGTSTTGAVNAAPLQEDVTVYVVEEGTVLPASSWNQDQSDACKASGGVEIPIPGGRIACFKL